MTDNKEKCAIELFYISCKNNNLDSIKCFMEYNCFLFDKDTIQKGTWIAYINQSLEVLEYLLHDLHAYIRPDELEHGKDTCLKACEKGYLTIIQHLFEDSYVENYDDIDKENVRKCFSVCCLNNYSKIAEYMILLDEDIRNVIMYGPNIIELFENACLNGRSEIAKLICSNFPALNIWKLKHMDVAFYKACNSNNKDMIDFLISTFNFFKYDFIDGNYVAVVPIKLSLFEYKDGKIPTYNYSDFMNVLKIHMEFKNKIHFVDWLINFLVWFKINFSSNSNMEQIIEKSQHYKDMCNDLETLYL